MQIVYFMNVLLNDHSDQSPLVVQLRMFETRVHYLALVYIISKSQKGIKVFRFTLTNANTAVKYTEIIFKIPNEIFYGIVARYVFKYERSFANIH